jgi:3-hydroxybutyryl-CoA dehydrogenase
MSQGNMLPIPETIAVVGLGLLGRGIATCFLARGFRVVGCDPAAAAHEIANDYIDRGLREMVEHVGLEASFVDTWQENYMSTRGFNDWPGCSFVVESVNEDPLAKQAVFDQIEQVVGSDVPVGSNTSAIPITQLQQARRHPARFFGMHWFEPAHATRFLELIPGEQTSQATMTIAANMARRCGKEPSVLAKDIPGFIVNRLGYAIYREALNLLELGVADAATIDRSFRNACGVWSTIFGPFQWMDLTGGPELYWKAMEGVLPTLSTATEKPAPIQRLIAEGARGVSNGRGFYNYTPETAKKADELFHAHAWQARALMDKYFPIEEK